ncbi:hypothetical protein [Nonomuraea sp. bgisy101]|uniref:hypothetical protein n=1 Tax=Nonomuraea sp. bgisy101 TaxID=3413784 RepID=UPI003D70B13E
MYVTRGLPERGAFAYRSPAAALRDGAHPDQAATALLGAWGEVLLHSTSRRFDESAVVLAHAACPDPRPDLPAPGGCGIRRDTPGYRRRPRRAPARNGGAAVGNCR